MRPKNGQAGFLGADKIINFVNTTEQGDRNDLRGAKIAIPEAGFGGGIVIQTFYGIGAGVRDLTFDRHGAMIPKADHKIRLALAEQALAAEFAGSGGEIECRDRARGDFLEADSG